MEAATIDDVGDAAEGHAVFAYGQSEGHEGAQALDVSTRRSAERIQVAEDLYTRGFISYPRTETDSFNKEIDLKKLVEKQLHDGRWGQYAQGWVLLGQPRTTACSSLRRLLDGGYRTPRAGRHDDQAHPPIHPVAYASPSVLTNEDERRLYEFVARHFLACCSEDAKGDSSTIEIRLGDERFNANGLTVRERNYLDVYPYHRWESSRQLPVFTLGEEFIPTEATMTTGKTSPPGYLTEPELLGLMEANGIGTDATMAEHIAKIKERHYVMTQSGGAANLAAADDDDPAETVGGGRGRGRGRGGRGRGGRGAAQGSSTRGSGSSVQIFIPTNLGVALIQGYEAMGFETSLSKPFLRKEVRLEVPYSGFLSRFPIPVFCSSFRVAGSGFRLDQSFPFVDVFFLKPLTRERRTNRWNSR